jgi:hypothetical protein
VILTGLRARGETTLSVQIPCIIIDVNPCQFFKLSKISWKVSTAVTLFVENVPLFGEGCKVEKSATIFWKAGKRFNLVKVATITESG